MARGSIPAIRKAVIPAAGIGTRLYPITRSQPKEMLPLGQKPTIQWVVEELIRAGIRSILFITGEKKRAIEDHFDPLTRKRFEDSGAKGGCDALLAEADVRLMYVRQGEPKGLADAILQADSFVGDEDFVVALGDVILTEASSGTLVRRLCTVHREAGASATLAVNEVPEEQVQKYGVIAPAEEEGGGDWLAVKALVEKPLPAEAPSRLAITGRYVLSPQVFDEIRQLTPGKGGELQLTDALHSLLVHRNGVRAVQLAETDAVLDIGDFPGYCEAFVRVALADPEHGARLRERLRTLVE